VQRSIRGVTLHHMTVCVYSVYEFSMSCVLVEVKNAVNILITDLFKFDKKWRIHYNGYRWKSL